MIRRLLPLLSRPSRTGASTFVLPIIAYACVTALLAIVLGGAQTFWSWNDELALTYQSFAAIALIVLIIPLGSLAQSAAKLTTQRRDERLASLRLLGLSARDTSRLALAEAVIPAALGAVSGVIISYLAAPLIGFVHFRGKALGTAGAALPIWAALFVALGVIGIAAASAWFSLRRVRISPLGVALKQQAPRLAWVTGLIAAGSIVTLLVVLNSIDTDAQEASQFVVTLLIGFGVSLLAIDLIGAWVLGLMARRRVKKAQTAADLLSARMILESPRTAWRQVSGLAMTSFVAVLAGTGYALIDAANRAEPVPSEYRVPGEEFLAGDVLTGIIITVIGSFLTVACSIGVSQAAQILDRRDVSRSLDIMGAQIAVQNQARVKAAMRPLLLASLGSATLAGCVLLPLVGLALIIAPLSLLFIASAITLGIVMVRSTLAATAPLLTRVARPALATP